MSIYVLDTDIVSYAMSGRYPQLREPFIQHAGNLAISSITYKELIFGCENGQMTDRCLQRVESILQGLNILAFDQYAAAMAGELESRLKQDGTPIGQMDTLIAGHVLALDSILVTNNNRHFERVTSLKLEKWV